MTSPYGGHAALFPDEACPVYDQSLDGSSARSEFVLNCAARLALLNHEQRPEPSAIFTMEFDIPANTSPGDYVLRWQMVEPPGAIATTKVHVSG